MRAEGEMYMDLRQVRAEWVRHRGGGNKEFKRERKCNKKGKEG